MLQFQFQSARSHGRALHCPLRACTRLTLTSSICNRLCDGRQQQQRNWTRSKSQVDSSLYQDTTPVATELKKSGIFVPRQVSGGKRRISKEGDGSRVNIVDEKLANDVVSFIKPSLERHKGCDLISVYPGAGLFAKALHDAVQPRSHLLLEPDEKLYKPLLKPLLDQKNVKLVPKSGIIWQELQEILTPEYLPNQVEFDRLDLNTDPPRNDTLLIDMNLSMYPRRKYNLFDSMSRMILYQQITSIRTSTQFQKYGLVRLLVWIPDEEKTSIVPRMIQLRKRAAVEAELMTEYVAEVCGKDGILDDDVSAKGKSYKIRPQELNFESLRLAMIRMREAGLVTPEGRETRLMRQFQELGLSLDTPIPLVNQAYTYDKAFQAELDEMQRLADAGFIEKPSATATRFKMLSSYSRWMDRVGAKITGFLTRRDAIAETFNQAAQAKARGDAELEEKLLREAKLLNDEYNKSVTDLPSYLIMSLNLMRDQVHVLRQPADMGPVLSWDRRPYEPLKVAPNEFFPNVPCALIDIQPKAPHKLLRHIGPGTSNAGDIFDLMLGMIMQDTLVPLVHTMDHIWPGGRDGLEHECKKLFDPATGGSPMTGEAAFAARAANTAQLLELLEEFMRWPFRPTYAELVGRLEDDSLIDDSTVNTDEDGPGGIGLGNTTLDAAF